VNVNRPLHDHRVFAERRIDKLGSFKYTARLPNERVEQSKLATSESERDSLGGSLVATSVNGDAEFGRHVVAHAFARAAASQRLDARRQHLPGERLGTTAAVAARRAASF